jgi:hypothetical protein
MNFKLKAFAAAGAIALALMTSAAHAGDKVGNPGDDVALDFLRSFATAMKELKTNLPELYSNLFASDLESIAKTAKVVVVDDALDVKIKDLIQSSVATNSPVDKLIMINRKRWKEISDSRLKEGIALHEVLSLRGLEQAGFYPYSSQYVASHGSSVDDLNSRLQVDRFKQIRIENPNATPYEILSKFFNEAPTAPSLGDFDEFHTYGNMRCQASYSYSKEKLDFYGSLQRAAITLKAEVPSAGPLFPGEPAIIETRIVYDAASVGCLDYKCQGHYFSSWFFVDWKDPQASSLTHSPSEIVERVNGNFILGSLPPRPLTETLRIRKNNGLIAFRIDREPKDRTLGTEGGWLATTYGYCYREKK